MEPGQTRRKYIGVGGDDVPSLGVLEGDILRLLWDAGEAQSSVQVYEAMYFSRQAQKKEMQSPSTIAVTLSRMVEKGLLKVERHPRGGKGFYAPTRTRAEVVTSVLDDVSRRLTGQSLGYILTRYSDSASGNGMAAGHDDKQEVDVSVKRLAELVSELHRVQRENCSLNSQGNGKQHEGK